MPDAKIVLRAQPLDQPGLIRGTLQNAFGRIVDICEIGLGLSKDCNANSVPDECDLIALTSADCNTNSIPDECDNAAPGTIVSNRPAILGFVETSATGTPPCSRRPGCQTHAARSAAGQGWGEGRAAPL